MNNKPVDCKHGVDDGACKECYLEATHPADLTDAEIIEIWTEFDNKDVDDYFIAIAREILRKAKEK